MSDTIANTEGADDLTDTSAFDDSEASAAEILELSRLVKNYWWRMTNLYKIRSVDGGPPLLFHPNWAQTSFMHSMWYFNIILKARQLGFSTYIDLHLLDGALFNDNHSCGIIAQGEEEAKKLLDTCRFAYTNLPQWIKDDVQLTVDNTNTLEFSNGSKIVAGISLRSGTYQKLHVSEYGKTSAKFPEKAKEIKTGSLNTVHAGNQIFIESTAEGQSGEFFDACKVARDAMDRALDLTLLDYKFHFYPWHKHPGYILPAGEALKVVINDDQAKYFHELETDYGITLTIEQKAWYVVKERTQGEDMLREFPSTADEAFASSVSGSIYGKQMRILRKLKQITRVPWEPDTLVHTYWDLGNFNYMAIWFFQQVGREYRMIRYYQNAGQDLTAYAEYLREQPYSYGSHNLPHDGNRTLLGLENKSIKQMLEKLGLKNVKIVPRTNDVRKDIETICKPALLKCWIDEVHCVDGIKCLDNYKKVWDKTHSIWREEPNHDEFSDGCDGFRTWAMSYKPQIKTEPKSMALNGKMGL